MRAIFHACSRSEHQTLKHSFRLGMGLTLPNRLYWALEMDEPESGEG
jgi:hypothetical protein